ncbi:MAG: GNAT family N-acetyltransferase [Oscillospiraceae bacterium]
MIIREYKPSDCEILAKLFYDTVHSVNIKDYTEGQVSAWATGEVDLTAWNDSFLEHYTVVAEEDGVIVGFGDIVENGYIDRLYVHKDHQHKGIGTAICDKLEKGVNSIEYTVHASITAKPFFESRGYIVVKEQQVIRRGVFLTNYYMKKRI